MRKFLINFVLVAAMVLPAPAIFAQRRSGKSSAAATTAAASRHGAEQITAAQLKNYLYFIAADAMEGRDTPSRGLDTTANFIAMNLERWGFKPAGDDPANPYFQLIALRRTRIDPAQTRAEVGGRSFTYGDDFLATFDTGAVSGPLVYVGNGWVFKSKNIDAYNGIDVKDKILVTFGSALPKGVNFADLKGKEGDDWQSPVYYAQHHGAKGMIVVPSYQTLLVWPNSRRAATEQGGLSVEKFAAAEGPDFPTITASVGMLNTIFQREKVEAAEIFSRRIRNEPGDSFELGANKKVSFNVATKVEQERTQNVVGVLEGSDPVLKNEYVAIGAHYDHVGTGAPGFGRGAPTDGNTNDLIYNGADDDGSGTTALLAMAETLAHNPHPKRSVLFVWHCGEEKGLWGSQYFTQNPTIPLDRVVAQLNIDMIGRSKKEGDTNPANRELSGPNEIYVIGSKMMSTELGQLSEAVNKSYLNISFNYRYDDPNDPNRFFFRSDHFNYAQKGIPIIFYFDGEHIDYHRPSDSPDKIDYQKMERVARTIYATLWEVASLAQRPVVDKKLPQELAGE